MRILKLPAVCAVLIVVFQAVPFLAQEAAVSKPVSFVVAADYDSRNIDQAEGDLASARDLEVHGWNARVPSDLLGAAPGQPGLDWLHDAATLAAGYDIGVHLTLTDDAASAAALGGGGDESVSSDAAAKPADLPRTAGVLAAAMARHRNVLSYAIDAAPGNAAAAPATYGPLLTSAAAALRARHPAAAVVFGGVPATAADWVTQMCGAGSAARAFNVVQVNVPIPGGSAASAANAVDGLPAFVTAVERACGRKRFWLNASFANALAGETERDRAAAWVRALATFVAEPRVEQVTIGSFRDRVDGSGTAVAGTGLVGADGAKRMAFYTVDMVTDLFGTETVTIDTRLLRATPAAPTGELHTHLFTRRDGDRVLFVWDRTAASTVALELPGLYSSVEFDIDGRPLHWDPTATPLASVTLAPGVPRIFRLAPKIS